MLTRLEEKPQLIVLTACQSAQTSTKSALSGLGQMLVDVGIPAVIAMQDDITVLTAQKFSTILYRQLLRHGIVDLAVNEARGTLITEGRYDAAVPVLFMRLKDGLLWDVDSEQEGQVDSG